MCKLIIRFLAPKRVLVTWRGGVARNRGRKAEQAPGQDSGVGDLPEQGGADEKRNDHASDSDGPRQRTR